MWNHIHMANKRWHTINMWRQAVFSITQQTLKQDDSTGFYVSIRNSPYIKNIVTWLVVTLSHYHTFFLPFSRPTSWTIIMGLLKHVLGTDVGGVKMTTIWCWIHLSVIKCIYMLGFEEYWHIRPRGNLWLRLKLHLHYRWWHRSYPICCRRSCNRSLQAFA